MFNESSLIDITKIKIVKIQVKRFAEGFFVLDNPRQSAAGCYDQNYQTYLAVSELAKRRYFYLRSRFGYNTYN